MSLRVWAKVTPVTPAGSNNRCRANASQESMPAARARALPSSVAPTLLYRKVFSADADADADTDTDTDTGSDLTWFR